MSLVLITGSTGFIGSKVTLRVLEAGYRVRLSIRREEQSDKLSRIFAKHVDALEFVIVPDLSTPGCFDSIMDGVQYVVHVASPLPGSGTTDLLALAVQGSVLSMIPFQAERERVVKERDDLFLLVDPLTVQNVSPMDQYHASKLAAHRATLDFAKQHTPSFDIVTLHPVFVFGRSLVQESAEGLEGSNGLLFKSLMSEKPLVGQYLGVHLDDVADAHVMVLDDAIKGFSSYLLASKRRSWVEVDEFVRGQYPSVPFKMKPRDSVEYGVDTTKAERDLGIKFKQMEEQVKDVVDQQWVFRSGK